MSVRRAQEEYRLPQKAGGSLVSTFAPRKYVHV
jgi:hypothetical protein